MASDIVTRRPEEAAQSGGQAPAAGTPAERARHARPLAFSALTRLIFAAQLAGLLVLILGSLVLNEMRQGLVQARIASLRGEGELIADVLAEQATNDAETRLDRETAREWIGQLYLPDYARVRLFSRDGELIADSWRLSDRVRVRDLPPVGGVWGQRLETSIDSALERLRGRRDQEIVVRSVEQEVAAALDLGGPVSSRRTDEDGERVVSVSVPVQRVQAVVGVLVLESGDVDAIVAAERRALIPFVAVALLMMLVISVLLTWFIARPLQKLARAADQVRRAPARRVTIPDLSARNDDIGDLSRALRAMTDALYARIDAIERFAADVSHEIKNPLTSIRSAAETLEAVEEDPAARKKLLGVLTHDVARLDRLISDISRASRLDAELAREIGSRFDLRAMLVDIADLYEAVRRDDQPQVVFEDAEGEPLFVAGLESLVSNVVRNLLDNARTFTPAEGCVRMRLTHGWLDGAPAARIAVEDEGPGIPPENLETVFERFYTQRPAGAAFGSHSGLGLSIARQIVDAHGGRIHAENMTAGSGGAAGARFVVLLPLAD